MVWNERRAAAGCIEQEMVFRSNGCRFLDQIHVIANILNQPFPFDLSQHGRNWYPRSQFFLWHHVSGNMLESWISHQHIGSATILWKQRLISGSSLSNQHGIFDQAMKQPGTWFFSSRLLLQGSEWEPGISKSTQESKICLLHFWILIDLYDTFPCVYLNPTMQVSNTWFILNRRGSLMNLHAVLDHHLGPASVVEDP